MKRKSCILERALGILHSDGAKGVIHLGASFLCTV